MIYWWFWGYKSFTGPRTNFNKSKADDSSAAPDEDEKEK